MINLAGVCLIRHHINTWDQVQATLIELDKYCDRILIFSFQQKFREELESIQHPKVTIKYLPLSANEEAIQKYIVNCLSFIRSDYVFYLEAGECFHHDKTSKVYIETLQLKEEEKVIGVDFPIRYMITKDKYGLDRKLPHRQIRIMRKDKVKSIHPTFGLYNETLKSREINIIPSNCELYSYGAKPPQGVLMAKKLKAGHSLNIKSWIQEGDKEFMRRKSFSPMSLFGYLTLGMEKISGKRMFHNKKYRHFTS